MEKMLWNLGATLFGGSMLAACIMDLREQMVYRFVWLIAGGAAGGLVVLRAIHIGLEVGGLEELILFVCLQQLWFCKFYGRADCHAFCVCAVALLSMGLGIKDWLMHMLSTFLGLLVIQLVRRNLKRNGKLKKPVPLIPYITVAFWVWVDFKCGK